LLRLSYLTHASVTADGIIPPLRSLCNHVPGAAATRSRSGQSWPSRRRWPESFGSDHLGAHDASATRHLIPFKNAVPAPEGEIRPPRASGDQLARRLDGGTNGKARLTHTCSLATAPQAPSSLLAFLSGRQLLSSASGTWARPGRRWSAVLPPPRKSFRAAAHRWRRDRPGNLGDSGPGGFLHQLEIHLPNKLDIRPDALLHQSLDHPFVVACRPRRWKAFLIARFSSVARVVVILLTGWPTCLLLG